MQNKHYYIHPKIIMPKDFAKQKLSTVTSPPYFCDGSRLTSPWFRLSGRLLEVNLPRVPAHFHHQSRTVFAVCLRFYSSLDPAQVLAHKICLKWTLV